MHANFPILQNLCAFPIPINPSRFDIGTGIENTLKEKDAKYHLSCYLLFNKTQVDRAKERAEKQNAFSSGDAEETDIKIRKKLILTQKVQLMQCLEVIVSSQLLEPQVESNSIDVSCFAHTLKPKDPSFLEYAMNTFANKVNNIASTTHKRTDIVVDIYKENSLKLYTRIMRGKGNRHKVSATGKVPKIWPEWGQQQKRTVSIFGWQLETSISARSYICNQIRICSCHKSWRLFRSDCFPFV